ncbi:MAG: M3 family oligoendopeptidase [Sphaerochaetaceae bacterium]|nr:M3 family oligoendopeptidase [Sphaerochaetaceae bacterium]
MEEKRWDLSPIYPSLESKEFTDDLAKLKQMLAQFKSEIESGKTSLAKLIEMDNEMSDIEETLGSYAYCNVSTNTTDKVAVNALNKVEELGMDEAVCGTLFTEYVANHPQEVEAYCADHPDYRYSLQRIAEGAKHQMSKEMEELAADIMRSGSDSYSRLQETISSSACAELDGKKLTVIQLRALATNADRETRRKAYEAELKVWKEHEVAFCYALNAIKGTSLSLEKRRNWESPIDRSCAGARISRKTLDALIATLEKNLPMFRSYLRTKAKLLGIEKCAFYDIFAPVGKAEMTYTYEQAREFVSKMYGTFNPEMGKFAANAFDTNWIDPFPRAGKTGGAYDIYMPKIRQSRVFANFDGTYDGVSTFAHELGHAWHDHVVSVKPAMLRSYPMTLAETASIFSEFIVFKGAVEQANDEQKLAIIEQFIQSACQVCVDILCRFYFEREIFERRAEGELMPDEMCAIMIDCQKRTYGDGLDENFLHPYMWAVKGHYYSTGFSFYNYPYAFGQLFGLGLYSRSTKEKSDRPFYEKYNELLSLTGQLSAEDVAASAGIDITDPAFWQEGMDIIASYAKQLEELAQKG